ncbi:MAG: sugar transferase [Microbacterium sp.]|uniref:sugar transferase n=1 Tax=Microbacterium sp. TaxID=51671 RepID=UPI00262BD7D5|nr:sugar transferase [Microbacterium sp.]MCX6502426.1 sugar transferase [Microbacterium sp.]
MPATEALTRQPFAIPHPFPLSRRARRKGHRRAVLRVTDIVAVAATTFAVAGVISALGIAPPVAERTQVLLLVAMVAVWTATLEGVRSRAPGIPGPAEYGRVVVAGALTFAVGATWLAVFPSDPVRAQLVWAVPLACVTVLVNRWSWRWLTHGRHTDVPRTLLVGTDADLDELVQTIHRDARLGYDVVGTTLVGPRSSGATHGSSQVPDLGPAASTAEAAQRIGADTVIVVGPMDDPDFIRRLSWQLEGTATELVVATRLTDVATHRMSLRTTSGLALIGVRLPTFDGPTHRMKRLLDIVTSLCALVPLALATPIIAAFIRLDSPGPVFFRQQRVGRDCRAFEIVKFRTMRQGAEAEIAGLQAANEGAGALFKIRSDPRVTRVGAVLRRYSIDEFPQFWNVLRGDMSVVGPRPPLPREVEAYDDPVFRRLYIRPGITGPWQIGGRSDLTWEQSVRLDLSYVENWSSAGDIGIMLRTVGVVARAKGAY